MLIKKTESINTQSYCVETHNINPNGSGNKNILKLVGQKIDAYLVLIRFIE